MDNISDIDDIKYLTKIRLKFNSLNEHKFRYNFDCLSPCCTCSGALEDSEDFLLHCPRFEMMCEMIGSTSLAIVENRIILEAAMAYMKATRRFS